MIYTSYYARINKIPENFVPVSIAARAPQFYRGLEYKKIAPNHSFFKVWKDTGDNDYYIKHYNEEILSKLNVKEVLSDLLSLTHSYDICLLCYEKSSDFCHRHLVRDWLVSNNVKCEEMII